MMARRAPGETRFFIGQAAPGVGHLCRLRVGKNFRGVLPLWALRVPCQRVDSTRRDEIQFTAFGRLDRTHFGEFFSRLRCCRPERFRACSRTSHALLGRQRVARLPLPRSVTARAIRGSECVILMTGCRRILPTCRSAAFGAYLCAEAHKDWRTKAPHLPLPGVAVRVTCRSDSEDVTALRVSGRTDRYRP